MTNLPIPTHNNLPRWRGFNLMEKMNGAPDASPEPFREGDFRFIAEHGFDFVRLPLDYRTLLQGGAAYTKNARAWDDLEEAAQYGITHGVHVNIGLHRAPGYCCNPPFEDVNLFRDDAPREHFLWLWNEFAQRFAAYGPEAVSFNLVNEPIAPTREQEYASVARAATAVIHAVRADRVVISDGLCWGRWGGAGTPSYALADDRVAQSVHCYEPAWLTFHKMNGDAFLNGPEPTWPGRLRVPADQCAAYPHELYMLGDNDWDRNVLRDYYFGQWRGLKAMGVGLHAGELSIYKNTPHDVALAYLEDLLSVLGEMNVGWAMWNLRGSFGIVDSQRTDAAYIDSAIGPVNQKMLALMQRY